MAEQDLFAMVIDKFGEPGNARKLAPDEAMRYRGRVPEALIAFWMQHGWGSYRDGYFWLCDPLAFDPLVKTIFAGDPDLNPDDISVVAYTGEGFTLLMWHRTRFGITAFPGSSELDIGYSSVPTDPKTGLRYSEAFLVGALLTAILQDDVDDYEELRARLGSLTPGDVFGYVPARQLGGEGDRQRVRVPEYFDLLAQLTPYKLMEPTPPEPGYPYGRSRVVRPIGRPR